MRYICRTSSPGIQGGEYEWCRGAVELVGLTVGAPFDKCPPGDYARGRVEDHWP
jgi:hypothetical protein